MISYMIDATEVQYVATYDITWSFLKTGYNKGDIQISMKGEMLNIIKEIDSYYYKDFIYIDNQNNARIQKLIRIYTEL